MSKVWVVSTFSVVAGVYSTEKRARKRAGQLGDAQIQDFEIDRDVALTIRRTERLSEEAPEGSFEQLEKVFVNGEKLLNRTE